MFPVYGVNDVPGLYRGNHSPLEGESQKPSRQAMADAVGGPTNTRHLAAGSASDRHSQGAAFPPSGSTAGFALASPTPPPGGSDLEACIRRSSITPPWRGSRRSRAGRRRLMRWGGQPIPATLPTSTSTQALRLPPSRGSRRSRAARRWLMRWGGQPTPATLPPVVPLIVTHRAPPSPPPARLRASPWPRRLPLQGGVILRLA